MMNSEWPEDTGSVELQNVRPLQQAHIAPGIKPQYDTFSASQEQDLSTPQGLGLSNRSSPEGARQPDGLPAKSLRQQVRTINFHVNLFSASDLVSLGRAKTKLGDQVIMVAYIIRHRAGHFCLLRVLEDPQALDTTSLI